MEWLMYDSDPVPSFAAPAVVKPRRTRYSLVPDQDAKEKTGVSTVTSPMAISVMGDADFPQERVDMINFIQSKDTFMQDDTTASNPWHCDAKGDIVTTSIIGKFAMLGQY